MTDHVDLYSIDFTLVSSGASLIDHLPPDASDHLDAVSAVDHLGRPTIPGSTVGGSLRAHLASIDAAAATRLFGAVTIGSASASRVRIVGVAPTAVNMTEDKGTAIDRRRGAARASHLREIRQLEPGSQFVAYLRADDLDDDDKRLWETTIASWAPTFGHGVSSGRGSVVIDRIRTGRIELTRPEGLRDFLSLSGPELHEKRATAVVTVTPPPGPDRWECRFYLVGDLFSGTGRSTSGHSGGGQVAQPRTILDKTTGMKLPVLTGRSIKGVLRARVEYILESVGLGRCVDATCSACLACRIFGWHGEQRGARALSRVHDSVVTGSSFVERVHIAIDRFTGGVANSRTRMKVTGSDDVFELDSSGLLYTRQVVRGGAITLTVERFGADDELWKTAKALLTLVAWDLHDGLIGVGGSTTRGYGSLVLADPDELLRHAAQQRLRDVVEHTHTEAMEGVDA